jgi:transcriptional regulator with XRE-family HTH domain
MSHTGTRLRTLRHERQLTQEQLARDAGIALNTVARIEAGRHEPNGPTLHKLARALGVTITALVDDTDETTAPSLR